MNAPWQQRYASKITTAPDAILHVPRGKRILIGSGAAEPSALVDALASHGSHLADNEIVHLLTLGEAPYVKPGMESRFRHTAFFIGGNVREAVHEGRADFMPVFLSDIPALIRSRRVRIDVVLIQVGIPDHHGFASLGVSVDIVRAAVDSASLVIAEVNPLMPRTLGDSFLAVDRIDWLVPVERPLFEIEIEPVDAVCQAIGRYVASLVPDGATLQTGIGRIPHAVLTELREHHDLGMHTEMLSDSVIDLVECGVLNGRRKTLLPGKLVTSFVMGTARLYEWVNDNPMVELRPTEFTNDPFTIARNDSMIAVNSALAVDLTGQVAADTVLGRFFSGIGGQVDFIRGAARSKGGKPIIALPSTAKDGSVSRIQAALEQGAGIVTSRGDVHYIVTEYGVADLWGKNVRERATALIEISHPDFRGELLAAAKQRRYVFPDQVMPSHSYPWRQESVETTRGEHKVRLRPARMSDEKALQDLLYGLSDESTYFRFLGHKKLHPHGEMQKMVQLDVTSCAALVACPPNDDTGLIVGMARYDVDPATGLADIAFVVRDEWHNRGVGSALFRRMREIGCERGLAGFTADVHALNQGMLKVFYGSGLTVKTETEGSVYHLTMTFPVV